MNAPLTLFLSPGTMLGLAVVALITLVAAGAPSPQIIGGRVSARGRWPWVVSLHRYRPAEGVYRHTCGGSLITPRWVLTAAHCVEFDITDYRVLVGAFDTVNNDAAETLTIKTIIKHENYNRTGRGIPNDIAVIELEREVDLDNPFVGLARLPRRGAEFAGNPDCWVAGWGRLNSDPGNWTASPVLLEVNTAVQTPDECRRIWREHLNTTDTNILDQHICIGLPDRGGCHGDSGSPANCDVTGLGDWAVAGLNSWGTGSRCAAATNAFVRVTHFLDWVHSHVPGLPGVKPPQPEWP